MLLSRVEQSELPNQPSSIWMSFELACITLLDCVTSECERNTIICRYIILCFSITCYVICKLSITHPATQLQLLPIMRPVPLANRGETVYGAFFMDGRQIARTRHIWESSKALRLTLRT